MGYFRGGGGKRAGCCLVSAGYFYISPHGIRHCEIGYQVASQLRESTLI